jgi:hypothetical protein
MEGQLYLLQQFCGDTCRVPLSPAFSVLGAGSDRDYLTSFYVACYIGFTTVINTWLRRLLPEWAGVKPYEWKTGRNFM